MFAGIDFYFQPQRYNGRNFRFYPVRQGNGVHPALPSGFTKESIKHLANGINDRTDSASFDLNEINVF
jgi:hypothetical protein